MYDAIALILFFGLSVASLIYAREWKTNFNRYFVSLRNSTYEIRVRGGAIVFVDDSDNLKSFELYRENFGHSFGGWPKHLSFIKKSALKSAALKVARISMENDLTVS